MPQLLFIIAPASLEKGILPCQDVSGLSHATCILRNLQKQFAMLFKCIAPESSFSFLHSFSVALVSPGNNDLRLCASSASQKKRISWIVLARNVVESGREKSFLCNHVEWSSPISQDCRKAAQLYWIILSNSHRTIKIPFSTALMVEINRS